MAIMNMQSETPLSSMKWGISQPFVQPIGQSIGQPIDQSIVQPAGQPTVVQSQQPVKQVYLALFSYFNFIQTLLACTYKWYYAYCTLPEPQ